MNRVRIRFSKHGVMKYLGHLDLLRLFQRAIRCADIPVAMSHGFSPHMLLSFAMPLSVGLTSEGEYFDMELVDDAAISEHEILSSLSAALNEGIDIISVNKLSDDVKNAMASVSAAEYIVYYKHHPEWEKKALPKDLVDYFESLSELLWEKETKKGSRTVDLRKEVFVFRQDTFSSEFFKEHPYFDENPEFLTSEGDPYFTIRLSGGSGSNIRPEAFFEVLLRSYLNEDVKIVSEGNGTGPLAVHRIDLFSGDSNEHLISLGG